MKNNSILVTSLTLIVLMFSVSFYWFGVRPNNIRKNCVTESRLLASNTVNIESQLESKGFPITKKVDYEKLRDERFQNCLLESGIKE